MNNRLPNELDTSFLYVLDFLDKTMRDFKWVAKLRETRNDFGNLYLTAKRSIYRHHKNILLELIAKTI